MTGRMHGSPRTPIPRVADAASVASMLVKPKQLPFSVIHGQSYYGCRLDRIASKNMAGIALDWLRGDNVERELRKLTERAGFGVKSTAIGRFGEGSGITVAIILAESLVDIHTYPETRQCAQIWLDYCCFNRDNSDKARLWWRFMEEFFEPDYIEPTPVFYRPVHPEWPSGLYQVT